MAELPPPTYEESQKRSEESGTMHPTPAVGPSAVFQTTPQPAVILQPAHLQPPPPVVAVAPPANIIVIHSIKQAPCYEPYMEFCPYCNETVMTVVRYSWGMLTWIVCFISCFLFCWPLIFVVCCNCSKDARHYCPCCSRPLAERRR